MSTRYISVRPHVQSGQPCLDGTRLPALQMADNYRTDGEVVLDWYEGLTRDGLLVCCWYAALYGPKRFRVWRSWARGIIDWETVALPPRGE